MSCPGTEHLDPRVRRTRALLQDAIRSLVKEKFFEDISVQDVTQRATVNRATFYAHYPDKNALLASVLKADFQSFMHARLDGDYCEFTPDSLRSMVAGIVEFVGEKHNSCPNAAHEWQQVLSAALLEELHDLFKHWLERGQPAAYRDHSPEMVATILSWAIYGAAQRWSRGKRKRTPAEVAESVVALTMPSAMVAA